MAYEVGSHSIAYVTAPNEEIAKNMAKYESLNVNIESVDKLTMKTNSASSSFQWDCLEEVGCLREYRS